MKPMPFSSREHLDSLVIQLENVKARTFTVGLLIAVFAPFPDVGMMVGGASAVSVLIGVAATLGILAATAAITNAIDRSTDARLSDAKRQLRDIDESRRRKAMAADA